MRAKLRSRFGFLMLAAGCAVGLGNVWRFPFIVGQNGGAAFVLVYLAFLAILGFPLLVVEFAIGRGGKSGLASAMSALAPTPRAAKIWRWAGIVIFAGNFLLMMYYTDVAGWLFRYAHEYAAGAGAAAGGVTDFAGHFGAVTLDKVKCTVYMGGAVCLATAVCICGVVKGVERVTKFLMVSLLALLGFLAVRTLTLPGASEGLKFYLSPDWGRFMAHPWRSVMEAMGQAFFTLSVGVGCMAIFGSYIGPEHSLKRDAAVVILIDTVVAILSGLVIFPVCFTHGVELSSGPGLIFIALPEVFSRMPFGRFWGFCFFLFLSFAAFTTIIAVFECIIGGLCDLVQGTRFGKNARRWAVSLCVGLGVAVASMPCILWDGVLAAEDFAMSLRWLPLGALTLGVFAVVRGGWGWKGFTEEVGGKIPAAFKWHMAVVIPLLILAVLIGGLVK